MQEKNLISTFSTSIDNMDYASELEKVIKVQIEFIQRCRLDGMDDYNIKQLLDCTCEISFNYSNSVKGKNK